MPALADWHLWYGKRRWQNRSRHQLMIEPLCTMCSQRGVLTPATIADHITPHHGDANLFWLGKLQSLCKPCHDRGKRLLETCGYHNDIADDGWPIDPKHPANQVRSTSRDRKKFYSRAGGR